MTKDKFIKKCTLLLITNNLLKQDFITPEHDKYYQLIIESLDHIYATAITHDKLVVSTTTYDFDYYIKYGGCIKATFTTYDKNEKYVYDAIIYIIQHMDQVGFSVQSDPITCICYSRYHIMTNDCPGIAYTIRRLSNNMLATQIQYIYIMPALRNMYLSDDMFDYTLICNYNKRICVHSLVLAIASDVFKKCISGNFIESSVNEIHINFDEDIIRFAIDCIYLNDSHIIKDHYSQEFMTELYSFAHMYNIKFIIDIATNLIFDDTDYEYVNAMATLYDNELLHDYAHALKNDL